MTTEQTERLDTMIADHNDTWDFSPKDRAVLIAARNAVAAAIKTGLANKGGSSYVRLRRFDVGFSPETHARIIEISRIQVRPETFLIREAVQRYLDTIDPKTGQVRRNQPK